MKKILFLGYSLVISCLLLSCEKQENVKRIITGIDINDMAKTHISDFILLRERNIDSIGAEYVFYREIDSVNVFITIELYSSTEAAEKAINEDFEFMSIQMLEGPHQGLFIGDKFWWWAADYSSNILTNVVFIRKNALFKMSCSQIYNGLKNLAKQIDNDIVNNEKYIEYED